MTEIVTGTGLENGGNPLPDPAHPRKEKEPPDSSPNQMTIPHRVIQEGVVRYIEGVGVVQGGVQVVVAVADK